MRPVGKSDPLKLNTTGCIILPSALFIALMIATAGVAIWPKLAAPGAAILCGGEVSYESEGASYRPGEYTVTRQIYCTSGTGKAASRDEITFSAMGVSFLIYGVGIFLLLQFAVRPLAARRLRGKLAALGMGTSARVQEAAPSGEAEMRLRNVSVDRPGGGDIAARLAQLKALRDQGLITAQDYEAKKAEILSGL